MHIWQNGWQETDTVCTHTRNYLFLPAQPAGAAPPAQPAR
jgi:hypothetical protein